MEPALSVVIAAYNAEDTLGRLLEGLVGQAPGLDWDVLVCDNRSTDGTAAVAEAYRDRLRIRVVPAPDRASGAYARNVGVTAGSAPWLAFVDADDEVAPDWVEAIARGLAEHPFVAGRLDATRLNDARTIRSRPLPQSTGLQPSTIGPRLAHAGGGNVGIHRAVYEKVGGYDVDLPGLEDTDFCWRVQLTGVPLVFVPEALLHVRLRSSLRGMWIQGRAYGRAYAALEARYGALDPAAVPEPVRRSTPPIEQPPGDLGPVGLLRAGDVGRLLWHVGWHVGHRRFDGRVATV